MNILKIKHYIFPINTEKSFIKEYNQEDLEPVCTVWDIWVQSDKAPFIEGNHSGNIRCEQMMATQGNLQSLVGKTISVKDSYDYVTDEHLFTFYMFRHNGIKDNEITFGKIENNKVDVHWKGIIEELGFEGEYNTNVPFELSCVLEIKQMVDNKDYKSPSTEVLRLIATADNDFDNNQELLEAIIDITDEYRLDDAAYTAIINLLSSESFLETFEEETDSLEDFISNFTHFSNDRTTPVPQNISRKALKKWRKIDLLAEIIGDVE
ncbi:hypothetical protein [Flavobacterium lindanitolerans]|uniref:hypothetical protein n=1 Tax=Flavobacterium lindanitolerans TaxID=428988 RepID=UPI0028067D1F|nr:hypothetical protein [Flavobacterium lindanitolerans]MDQ7961466.1 hypothetical protein [Flavobacterium lindanitolerans]